MKLNPLNSRNGSTSLARTGPTTTPPRVPTRVRPPSLGISKRTSSYRACQSANVSGPNFGRVRAPPSGARQRCTRAGDGLLYTNWFGSRRAPKRAEPTSNGNAPRKVSATTAEHKDIDARQGQRLPASKSRTVVPSCNKLSRFSLVNCCTPIGPLVWRPSATGYGTCSFQTCCTLYWTYPPGGSTTVGAATDLEPSVVGLHSGIGDLKLPCASNKTHNRSWHGELG